MIPPHSLPNTYQRGLTDLDHDDQVTLGKRCIDRYQFGDKLLAWQRLNIATTCVKEKAMRERVLHR